MSLKILSAVSEAAAECAQLLLRGTCRLGGLPGALS